MNIEIEIQNAIRSKLPEQVGEVLRKRLEQAESDARDLEIAKKQLHQAQVERNALNDECRTYRSQLEEFRKREAELIAREKQATKLEMQAQAEKEKTQLVLGMFGTVFQNRVVREDRLVQKESHTWSPGAQGPNTWQSQVPEMVTTTES